jgi:SP family general alpha glucoside:H+ symporter-like MFS transporter
MTAFPLLLCERRRSVVDKSIAVGGAAQFATSVVITFVIPYMQNPGYGNLGTKIAFIFAGLCLVT